MVDAEACCEAVSRPSMQFVPLESVPEQAALMTHRARQLLSSGALGSPTKSGHWLRARRNDDGSQSAELINASGH